MTYPTGQAALPGGLVLRTSWGDTHAPNRLIIEGL